MTNDYSEQIERIKKASSLEEIQEIARRYPAKASLSVVGFWRYGF